MDSLNIIKYIIIQGLQDFQRYRIKRPLKGEEYETYYDIRWAYSEHNADNFIHLTVVSDNIIEHETNSSLNSSMDYAYDKMMDDYEDISFVEYYKSPCFVWFDSDGFIEHISKDNTYNNATGTYYEKGEDVLTDDLMKNSVKYYRAV